MEVFSKFPCMSEGVKQLSMIYEIDEQSSVAEAMPLEQSSESDGSEDTD
jgi:hypothetical protein